MDWIRLPARLAAIAGVLAAMTVNQLRPPDARKWSRRMFHRAYDSRLAMLELAAAGAPGALAIGLMAAIAVAALSVGTYAFLTPTFRVNHVPVPYEHRGQFSYAAKSIVPDTLPSGLPCEALAVLPLNSACRRLIEVPVETGQPLLLNVNPNFDISFHYELASEAVRDVAGVVSLHATIADITGWERRYAISPMSEFRGRHVDVTVSQISLRSFMESVSVYQAVTGHAPRYYTATLTADVRVHGVADGVPFDEAFTPRFVMRIVPPLEVYPETEDTRALELPGESRSDGPIDPFYRTKRGDVSATTYERSRIPFLRWSLDMPLLRIASLATLGAALCAIAATLMLARSARLRGEAFLIRAQYGPSLVLIDAEADGHDPSRFIRVSTMDDLARLAQLNGGPILVELRQRRQTYLVREGEHFYTYEGEAEGAGLHY